MILILLKDVKGTGKAGDVVNVSDGYGRNFLLPRGLAQKGTEGNIRSLEKAKELQEEKFNKEKNEAQILADKIANLQVDIVSKSGEGGRLFGSITSNDIAEALKEQHKIEIDKKKIMLDSPIKQTGDFQVKIKLYFEVVGTLKIKVTV
ncbi:MAG: 50S ribosomal protein L9 [Anaerovoracaceae bacterium]|jgi:large subunit ribosomal protein L9|nr:50S ribosomal protein L9 [Anaerovoracaceae bacterium]